MLGLINGSTIDERSKHPRKFQPISFLFRETKTSIKKIVLWGAGLIGRLQGTLGGNTNTYRNVFFDALCPINIAMGRGDGPRTGVCGMPIV